MKCFAVIALLIAVSQSALILSADTHATLQELCGNLVDNPMLGNHTWIQHAYCLNFFDVTDYSHSIE